MNRGATLLRSASRTREPARRAALVAALFATLAAAWAYNVRETRDRTISLSTGNPARANLLVEVLSARFPGLLAETRSYTDEWRPPLETWCDDSTRGVCLPRYPDGHSRLYWRVWLDDDLQEAGRMHFAFEIPFLWTRRVGTSMVPRDADGDGAWEVLYSTDRCGAAFRLTQFGPELLGGWCIDPGARPHSALQVNWVRSAGTCFDIQVQDFGAGPAKQSSVRLSWDCNRGILAYPQASALPLYFLSLPNAEPQRATEVI